MIDAIFSDINNEQSLVFGGIAWKPLIGSNLSAQSEKMAAANKATHFVEAGEHSAAVGTTKLPADKLKETVRAFYSAAAVFAQAHQNGVIISSLAFPDGNIWVVAAHNGVVVRDTDVLLQSEEEAQALVAEIKQRLGGVEVEPGFEANQYLNNRTQLQPVRSAFQKIPNSVKILIVFVVLLFTVDTSLTQYKKYKVRKAQELEASQYIDAHAEWVTALNRWASSIKPDGRRGLLNLYAELGDVPMKIGGWNLVKASCSSIDTGWTCNAKYSAGVNASNLSFANNLPKGWVATWDGLTGAIGSWTFAVERNTLDRAVIQTIPSFSLRYISELQRILPGLRTVELAPPVLVQVAEPEVYVNRGKGDERVPVPYPAENTAGIEMPSVQTYVFEGPFRTLAVLPLINQTVIQQLSFDVGSVGSIPTLRDSIFTAKLVGEIYVR